MRFFGLKSCDTCRKALKALAGHEVDVIDVRADGVSDADRTAMIAAFGDGVLNKRSTTWRQLSEAEQAQDPATLIAAHLQARARKLTAKMADVIAPTIEALAALPSSAAHGDGDSQPVQNTSDASGDEPEETNAA